MLSPLRLRRERRSTELSTKSVERGRVVVKLKQGEREAEGTKREWKGRLSDDRLASLLLEFLEVDEVLVDVSMSRIRVRAGCASEGWVKETKVSRELGVGREGERGAKTDVFGALSLTGW